MPTGTGADGEIDAVERLAAQEAFDDNLESIHAALSKRDSIRLSLSSNRSNSMKITAGKGSNASLGDDEESEEFRDRGARSSDRRSLRSSRRSHEQEVDKSDRRRRRSHRRHNSKTEGSGDVRPIRSASAIEKLLEYNGASNYSTASKENKNEKKSSMNPLLLGLSKSRDSTGGLGGRSSHNRRNNSRERRHSSTSRASSKEPRGGKRGVQRSSSASQPSSRSPPRSSTEGTQQDPRQRLRRQRSSSNPKNHSSHHQRERSAERVIRQIRSSKSLRSTRSYTTNQESSQEHAISNDPFERLWGKKITGDDLNQTQSSRNSNSTSGTENGKESLSPQDGSIGSRGRLGSGAPEKVKKTKLEKIHELQAKCDVFKMKLENLAEEQRTTLSELNDSRAEVVSLKKIVDVHEEHSTKLKSKLSEVQNELDTTKTEQLNERTKFSHTTKDLAQVNLDYAKSIDMTRNMREELDNLREVLVEREEKISVVQKDLEASEENVRQLEADVLYADDQIEKLETEIKKLEKELALYSEAADRDALHPNGSGNGANLQEVKIESEKRKLDELEKEIKHERKILEGKMEEFEREKVRFLEEQQRKEREFEERISREEEERNQEVEKLEISDQDRQKKEDETNKRLNALEDENAALNGRLKSEQLESTMKLQNKDNSIAELQTEVARLTKEQKERNSAPDSSASLLLEIETLKIEARKSRSDFEEIQMNKIELENEVDGLQNANIEITARLADLETETAEQRKEVENQRRKARELQMKTGEWREKAFMWKEKSEQWEKKAKESSNDSVTSSGTSNDAAQVEPQDLFLQAALAKKASNESAANANASWRFGRILGRASYSEDETQVIISRLEGEKSLKDEEIKALKSEMVKMQTTYKEKEYSMTQECEKLRKEKEAIEQNNINLLDELELARKLNRTISDSDI